MKHRRQTGVCERCSDKTRIVKHHHYCATSKRDEAVQLGNSHYWCDWCRCLHEVNHKSSRTKIIISSSTLHGGHRHSDFIPYDHCNFETIPGARIKDVCRIVQLHYMKNIPIDLVIVVGLNNLLTDSSESIIQDYINLLVLVNRHSINLSFPVPSTVAIATLVYPPKFCSFIDPTRADFPRHLSTRQGSQMVGKINNINQGIILLSKRDWTISVRSFHINGYGVRRSLGGKMLHRMGDWIEKEPHRRLHVIHKIRAKILLRIQHQVFNFAK